MKDEYATLRAAFHAGARIQAWTLREFPKSSNDGYWRLLGDNKTHEEPKFSCEPHLYRVYPEDRHLIAELGQEVAPVVFAVELSDGSLGALGWIDYGKFEQVKNMGTLAKGARYVFAYRDSPAHTSEARDWEGVEHVASHIENAVDYITKQYPDARMLDRAPIMRNMRRWARNLRSAMRQEAE